MSDRIHTHRVATDCIVCGATVEKLGAYKCYGCASSREEARPTNHKPKKGAFCLQCEDMSWRRQRGHVCKCGKWYAPEQGVRRLWV